MTEYNPFGKPFAQVGPADLESLKDVAESWYVEYKREVPDASSIAKSISAFANTYGGWLFYGIEEKDRKDQVAGRFVGIPSADLDRCLQRIRHAVAGSLNPSPHFEVKVLAGPCSEIGLLADQSIIAVAVPSGHAAPFVHSTGRIYRRVGDGSEPKPETDRFVLDQLWRRGDKIREEYADWLGKDLDLSKSEESQPYLRLFLVPDLWRDQNIWADLTTARVREIMSATHEMEETMSYSPFDTVYRTASGFVCRQIKGNVPGNLTMTWFLRQNLASEIILPIPVLQNVDIHRVSAELDGYLHAKEFAGMLNDMGVVSATILDLNFVFTSLVGIMHCQSLLDKEADRQGSFFVKAEIINVWRTFPFVDSAAVVAHQQEFGVPMCMNERFFAPPGKEPDYFTEIAPLEEIESIAARKMFRAVIAFESIAHAFGIETGTDGTDGEFDSDALIHDELFDASKRALLAQERRNKRWRRHRD